MVVSVTSGMEKGVRKVISVTSGMEKGVNRGCISDIRDGERSKGRLYQ